MSKSKIMAVLATSCLIVVLLVVAYLFAALNYSYSEGDRTGTLNKLSKKGWIWKTWEGELLVSAAPGSVPEKFAFSVRDDHAAELINGFQGKSGVVVHYQQHKGLPRFFGDSEYFVTAAKANL